MDGGEPRQASMARRLSGTCLPTPTGKQFAALILGTSSLRERASSTKPATTQARQRKVRRHRNLAAQLVIRSRPTAAPPGSPQALVSL